MRENMQLLDAVADAARVGGREALRRFRGGLVIEQKPDGSPVTDADRAAERAVREWVAGRFPKDGVLGEEFGAHDEHAARRWIVDPIDGTRSYVRGVPMWGTLVAVAEGERVLAGAIFCAALDELVCAEVGRGCWWNGTRASVSEVSDLNRALALTTDPAFTAPADRAAGWRDLSARANTSRGWGDCYGYLLVATGRAEVMVDPVLSAWDSAPLQPIIDEAGGRFTDWAGRRTAFGGSAVASNAALADVARGVLQAGSR